MIGTFESGSKPKKEKEKEKEEKNKLQVNHNVMEKEWVVDEEEIAFAKEGSGRCVRFRSYVRYFCILNMI